MNTFQPDLIVEVTGACNRACVGCYAPNVVAKDAASVYETRPELFIGATALNNAWNDLSEFPRVTAIRGGEPTLHPELPVLLKTVAKHSVHVYLETHGRWLMEESFIPYMELLETIKTNQIIVKISFDKMHGLKADELQRMTHFLSWHDVDYKIAITESSLTEFIATRSLCSFVKDEQIIYQPKAVTESELVKPLIGTINVRGELKRTLTHKFNEDISLGVAFA